MKRDLARAGGFGLLAAALTSVGAGCAAHASTFSVVYAFPVSAKDGDAPVGTLVNVNGILYGATTGGGAYHCGTVFSLTPKGVERVVYSFRCGSDGNEPEAGLTNIRGVLYGTTRYGAPNSNGTVFKVTRAGIETPIHSFSSIDDGIHPNASLLDVGGSLFGTTEEGGPNIYGTVYNVTKSGSEHVVYSFAGGTDGGVPLASLIDVGGALYGTTSQRGTHNAGTVFKVTPEGSEITLYDFGGYAGDGATPTAQLLDVNGSLYGTTQKGGATGAGTIFKLTLSGHESVVYSFHGYPSDGEYPIGGLVEVGGKLYGTTADGGSSNSGTIFELTLNGAESVLYDFGNTSDGRLPGATMTYFNGALYGTASGGANHGGVVFRIIP